MNEKGKVSPESRADTLLIFLAKPSKEQLRRVNDSWKRIEEFFDDIKRLINDTSSPDRLLKVRLEIQSLRQLYDQATDLHNEFVDSVEGTGESHDQRITELVRLGDEIESLSNEIKEKITATETETVSESESGLVSATETKGASHETDPISEESEDVAWNNDISELGSQAGYFEIPSTSYPPGAEILESELLNGPIPEPTYAQSVPGLSETEIRPVYNMSDLYRRWQDGDTTLLPQGEEIWWSRESLVEIRRHLGLFFKAAGYTKEDIDEIYNKLVDPWSEEVGKKRTGNNKDIKWGKLRDEILSSVRDLLADKEPDQVILGGISEANTGSSPESTETESDLVIPDTLEGVESELDLAFQEYAKFDKEIEEKYSHRTDLNDLLETGMAVILAHDNIREKDENVVLQMKQKYLKTLSLINRKIKEKIAKAETDDASSAGVPGEVNTDLADSVSSDLPGIGDTVSLPQDADYNRVESTLENDLAEAMFRYKHLKDRLSMNRDTLPGWLEKSFAEADRLCSVIKLNSYIGHESLVDLMKRNDLAELQEINARLDIPETTYTEARLEQIKAKDNFIKARDSYYEKLHEFYNGRIDGRDEAVAGKKQNLRRLTRQAREMIGGEVALPDYLQELKNNYDLAQRNHAISLDAVLNARAAGRSDVTYESLASHNVREAFSKHFTVRSVERENIAKQVEGGPSSPFITRVKQLGQQLKKHKWLVRAGTLALWTGIGAVTGGTSAALAAGSRVVGGIAAGMAGGALGGALGHKALTEKVKQTAIGEEAARTKDSSEFSFDKMAAGRDTYAKALRASERAKKQQKALAIAGAVVGGIVAGRSGAEAAVGPAESISDAWYELTTKPVLEMDKVLVQRFAQNGDPLPAIEVDGISLRAGRSFGVVELSSSQKALVETTLGLKVKALLDPHPNMNQGKVEAEVLDHLEKKFGSLDWWQKANIKAIDFDSIRYEQLTNVAAPVAIDGAVSSTAAVRGGDPGVGLPARASLTPERTVVPSGAASGPVATAASVVEASASAPAATVTGNTSAGVAVREEVSPEAVVKSHTVTSGETLTGIMKEKYADLLGKLSPTEQNRVLDMLFDKTRVDSQLRDSIGLRNGNVDKIYIGDQLKLDKLGAELKDIITSTPARPRTGALPVNPLGPTEAAAVPVRPKVSLGTEPLISKNRPATELPINRNYLDLDETKIVEGYLEQQPKSILTAETGSTSPSPAVYNLPRPPSSLVLDGRYFESRAYTEFLRENGFSREAIEAATDKFAIQFEGKTYSWINELVQKFDSPYKELGKITIKEMNEIGNQAGDSEEALKSILREKTGGKTFNLPTIRIWAGLIDELRQSGNIKFNENTPLSDLIKRHVAEQMIKNNYNQRFNSAIQS